MWYEPIMDYLELIYDHPADKNESINSWRQAQRYIVLTKKLYKRGFDGVYMKCVTKKQGERIIEIVHGGDEILIALD